MSDAFFRTRHGRTVLGDSTKVLAAMKPKAVDLIVTSPPFGLVRKKDYGNVDADAYLAWFAPFAVEFKRVLRDSGSLVIDIGGAWIPGQPTRSLYHFKLLIMLCEQFGFHLAEEFYWWNPSKLPTPAEWVTVRRIRAKDAVDPVWWLSPTPWPKASNRRVLQPYSGSMRELLERGYKAKKRPSGHDISSKFSKDNGAAIPPNLITVAHTESNSYYQRYCRKQGIKVHPARFPAELPEFFIRMLTDRGDIVVDPFAGSCVTGEVCERLARRWVCIEIEREYLEGARGRFERPDRLGIRGSAPRSATGRKLAVGKRNGNGGDGAYYRVPRPGFNWDTLFDSDRSEPLSIDGGRQRPRVRGSERAS